MGVRRFDIEPPESADSGRLSEWDVVEYESGLPSAGFILPPPRRATGDALQEVTRRVGDELARVRDVTDATAVDVSNMGAVVTDYGDKIENKVEAWAVPTVAPLSQTINRRADSSFQLSDFMIPAIGLTGNTAISDGHTHSLGTGSLLTAATTLSNYAVTGVKGRIFTTFLTPAINRVYERLNFIVVEVSSPCQLDVSVYVVDSSSRELRRQVHVPNAGATIGTAGAVVSIEFPPWVATQGSYIAVSWVQHGSGNVRGFHGLREATRPLPTAYFPRSISAQSTATNFTGLPDSIDGNDTSLVDFSYAYTAYVELSENIGTEYRFFAEPWRGVGRLSRPWVALEGGGVYAGNGYVGAGGLGYRVSVYDTPLSTDHVRIQSSINEVFDNDRRSTLIIRGSNNLRSGVGLSAVSRSRYELIQWDNATVDSSWDNRTVLAAFGGAPAAGDQIVIEYHEGVVDVWIGEVHHVVAQSVGGPAGAAGRFVGIQTERTGNIFVAYPSPRFGPWSARDVPDGDGEDDDGTGESGS